MPAAMPDEEAETTTTPAGKGEPQDFDEVASTQPGDAAVGEGRSESGTSTPAPVASESRSEASNVAPPEPQEDLRSALVGLADAELKEMGRRLAQSRVGLEEALEVELDEGRALKDENDYLKQTIDFMFSELGKLNIKGTNLTDPQLAEGPLDFVGRYWEKVRPRNNTVVVSEHVGEIDHTKKPQDVANLLAELGKKFRPIGGEAGGGEGAERGEAERGRRREELDRRRDELEELGRQAAERGKLLGRQIGDRVRLLSEQGARLREEGVARLREEGAKLRSERERPEAEGGAKAPGVLGSLLAPAGSEQAEARANALKGLLAPFRRGGKGEASGSAAEKPQSRRRRPGAEEASAAAADAAPPAENDAAPQEPAPPAPEPAEAPSAEAPPAAAPPAAADAEAEEGATVLLVAKLTLQDGSVAVCRVRAADRIKTVAKNFVREHALDATVEEPLRKYLMKAESDAETFPVSLEADLAEICK